MRHLPQLAQWLIFLGPCCDALLWLSSKPCTGATHTLVTCSSPRSHYGQVTPASMLSWWTIRSGLHPTDIHMIDQPSCSLSLRPQQVFYVVSPHILPFWNPFLTPLVHVPQDSHHVTIRFILGICWHWHLLFMQASNLENYYSHCPVILPGHSSTTVYHPTVTWYSGCSDSIWGTLKTQYTHYITLQHINIPITYLK